jgi:hypothetical protein
VVKIATFAKLENVGLQFGGKRNIFLCVLQESDPAVGHIRSAYTTEDFF